MVKKVKKGDYIEVLLRSDKTVFSTKEIAMMWGEEISPALRNRLSDYVKRGKLIRLRKGFYAKDDSYSRYELATKVYTPSYISFETVLLDAGITFQAYDRIFTASYLAREIEVDNQVYEYRKIKDTVLTNDKGIIQKKNYYIASAERAFLDIVYLSRGYHFDNLTPLDWRKVEKIAPIYRNKSMMHRLNKYRPNA